MHGSRDVRKKKSCYVGILGALRQTANERSPQQQNLVCDAHLITRRDTPER